MSTRERITQVAIKAFNKNGYHAMTLSDLAVCCEMSRGNLAYHYKYKRNILQDIVERMILDIDSLQSARKEYPAFSNLALDIKTYGVLQERYPFIFRDTSVGELPAVRNFMRKWSEKSIKRNIQAFAYGVEVRNLHPEPYPGIYYQLAVNAWMINYYWISQLPIRKIKRFEQAERMVWSTILPHFTTRGLRAFKGYYGENYLQKLGKPVDRLINKEQV